MVESQAGGLLVDCPRQLICQSAKANDHSRATVKHGTCHVEAAGRSAGHQRATGWQRAAGGGGPAGHRPINSPYSCSLHARSR